MLQLHTDIQDGASPGMSAMQGSMSTIQSDATAMQSGVTPMQADQSNMALIPQRPEHMMLQQKEIETVENPTGTRDVTNSSIRGLLARNLGYYIGGQFPYGYSAGHTMGRDPGQRRQRLLSDLSAGSEPLCQRRYLRTEVCGVPRESICLRRLPPPGCLSELVKKGSQSALGALRALPYIEPFFTCKAYPKG